MGRPDGGTENDHRRPERSSAHPFSSRQRRVRPWLPSDPMPISSAERNRPEIRRVPGASRWRSSSNSFASRRSFACRWMEKPGRSSSAAIFGPRFDHIQDPAAFRRRRSNRRRSRVAVSHELSCRGPVSRTRQLRRRFDHKRFQHRWRHISQRGDSQSPVT